MAEATSPDMADSSRVARSPGVILAIVGFSVFVAADDLTVVTTMLRPIVNDLGLVLPDGLDEAAWIVNVYLIAFVAVMPIAGRVSDVIGRRLTFIGAYSVFLVGTTLIPLTSSLGPFLVARVLTALGGGAMVPVALAVVGDVYAEQRRARALGTLGAIETMGWVWGPLYGALLVRFLSWRWQFWLNIPLALFGMAAVWWALEGHEQSRRHDRVDWAGATALTVALVTVNLALLGNAEIQSVTGLEDLTGSGSDIDYRWFLLLAGPAIGFLVWHERRSESPLIDRSLFRGRNLRIALAVNFVVGAVLVIAMVDVPIFVNAVEGDLERSAVIAGWILSALTAAMAAASYLGGRLTERTWYRPPVIVGLGAAAAAFLAMGLVWEPSTSPWVQAAHLALLGAGLGLVVAPTTSAVVDSTAPEDRGAAASVVMVIRLIGLSVGLSALTAYGLDRYNDLREGLELPDLTDPGFDEALSAASAQVTADALGETFLASAAVAAVGLVLALVMRRASSGARPWREGGPMSEPLDEAVAEEASGLPAADTRGDGSAGARRFWAVGVLATALVAAGVAIAVLFVELDATRDDLGETREDLERVEAGAALWAGQLQNLLGAGPAVTDGIESAIAGLEDFSSSTIELSVDIEEEVQVDTEVVIRRTVRVPISESIPISETISTTIEVETPLGFSVPIDVTVPVDIDVPVELEIEVPIDETIPVSATIPVDLEVPIVIEVAETELASLATSLSEGLRSFSVALGG